MKTVVVATTAGGTEIAPAGHRRFIHIQNPAASTESVFIKYDGDATALTASNGFELIAGATLHLNNDLSRPIFNAEVVGITVTGNVTVIVQGE